MMSIIASHLLLSAADLDLTNLYISDLLILMFSVQLDRNETNICKLVLLLIRSYRTPHCISLSLTVFR